MIPVVIFEGSSGSGKTTLRYMLYQAMKGNVLTIDRFTPSIWVYDYLRGINRTEEIQEQERKISDSLKPLLVILEYDSEQSRFREDPIRESNFSVKEEDLAFKYYLNHITKYDNILLLNTSVLSKKTCITMIRNRIW